MPPMPSEEDINAPRPTGNDSASPPAAKAAPAANAGVRIAKDLEELHRDEAELKVSIIHLRTDVARAAASVKKSIQMTGAMVAVAVLAGVTAINTVLVSGHGAASEAGADGGASMAALRAEIEATHAAVKALNGSLAHLNQKGEGAVKASMAKPADAPKPIEAAKPVETARSAVTPDCAGLPAEVKANAVDFSIQFDVASAKIAPASEGTLAHIAKILALAPRSCILIEGHTDASGKTEKNLALSKERAVAVADHIAEKGGVERKRLVPQGKGSSSPLEGVDPRDPRNRRVVFKVVAD